MKQVYLVAAFMTLSVSLPAIAREASVVPAPIEKIFVPEGFDDNDKVELIVHGHFNSTCYKMGSANAVVDAAANTVSITAEAYYYPDAACSQMEVAFIKSVEISGFMEAGSYKVRVTNSPSTPAVNLVVRKSTRAEPDDFLYAGIQSATYDQTSDGPGEIVLKGQHPHLFDGCVRFETIKANVSSTNVLVVQPVTKIVPDSECTPTEIRFEKRLTLSRPLPKGEYVMHVRALDGNAVNQLVTVD